MNIPYLRALAVLLVLTCVTTPLRAASADPYVPDRAEFFVRIDVRKFCDATLVRQDLDKVREALKGQPDIQAVLDATGFDPFTDLDTLTVAGTPSHGSEQVLVIAHGRFDKKLIAWTQKMLSEHGERLAVVEERGWHFLSFDPPGQAPLIYFGWPDSGTIVASPVKGFVARAMEVGSGKVQPSLQQPAADLLKELDDTKVVSFMALGSAFHDTPQADLIRYAAGSLGINEGVQLAVTLATKSPEAAEQLAKSMTEGLAQGKRQMSLLSRRQKELEPIALVLGAVQVTRDGDTVNIMGNLTKDMLAKRNPGRAANPQSPSPRDPVRRPPSRRPPRNP
jgi:hypothetical protein